MSITKNRGISRIDSEVCRTYGWYVRARFNGKVISKLFSDNKHGGKAKALMKARRFHKKSLAKLMKQAGQPLQDKIPTRTVVTKNKRNNTGVVGVQKVIRKNKRGTPYQAYRVNWTDRNGKSRTKFFSIKILGDKNAFRTACKYREEKVMENYFS